MEKEIEQESKRTRRYVYISDDLYKKVGKEAIDLDVDNGTVIEAALEKHFKEQGREMK